MTDKDHNIAVTLNEQTLSLIQALNTHFGKDRELPEVVRQLERVSKYLVSKQLKTFDDENNKI